MLSFEMAPGDCIVHHGYALHGAPGTPPASAAGCSSRAGPATTSATMPTSTGGSAPGFPNCGLAEGAPMDCDTFPVLRRA